MRDEKLAVGTLLPFNLTHDGGVARSRGVPRTYTRRDETRPSNAPVAQMTRENSQRKDPLTHPYFFDQSRRWRLLGMSIFSRYLVTVRRATLKPSVFRRRMISMSL